MILGFIGLGNMGSRMVPHLLRASHSVVVADLSEEAVASARALGASAAASPAEVASRAEIVMLSLPGPAQVKAVVLGKGGVNEGTAVKTVIDFSTTGPSVAAEVAAAMATRDVAWLDCPLSGGTTGAENAALTMMISGREDVFRDVEPVLDVLGKKRFYLGPRPGQAQTLKIINNALTATNAMAAFECLVFGAKAGIDARAMLDVINASSGRSLQTEVKIPQCILDRSFPLKFTTELLHKDVNLCVEEAAKHGVPMWVTPIVRQVLANAIVEGDGPKDFANVIKRIERIAGAEFGQAPLNQQQKEKINE